MKDIKTSIIVVAYNCSEVIEENITSCCQEIEAELIIVDNASVDDTVDKIKPYISENVHLIRNKENKGFTYACNQGIKLAKGGFILLLNPDASLEPGTLDAMSKNLNNNPQIGAVAPVLFYPDGSFQNYTRTFPTVSGLWIENFVPNKYWNKFKAYRNYTCQDIDFTTEQNVDQPAGAAFLFRKNWLLDEAYFIYGSDVDLCKTIKEAGYEIIQTPSARVVHHQSKGGTENMKLRPMLDADNFFAMRYYFKKFNQRNDYYKYIALFGISLFGRMILSIFQGKEQLRLRYSKLGYFLANKNFQTINGR